MSIEDHEVGTPEAKLASAVDALWTLTEAAGFFLRDLGLNGRVPEMRKRLLSECVKRARKELRRQGR